jgi:tight adherence protein B
MKWLVILVSGFSAFMITRHYAQRWIDWFRFQSIGTRDYVVERLNQMFIEITPDKALVYMLAGSITPGFIVFLSFLPNFVPGIFLGTAVTALLWKLPKPIVDYLYRSRVDKIVNQMVDGLAIMSNGIKSGLSVNQAMGVVVQEMPDPIRQEFNAILSENKLGVSLEDSLINFSKRVKSDDVEMFVTAVNILKETGGNLAETFDTITTTIRERIKVEGKIKALTAQGLYQGLIIAAVPPGMMLMFYQSDPEFMKPLFTTIYGWVVLTIVLILEVVGFLVIRRIIKIEV